MAPCKPKQCPPNQKWDSTTCKCKRSIPINIGNNKENTIKTQSANVLEKMSSQAKYDNTPEGRKERREKATKLFKKGGSTIKGSSLRRQASSKGLRTSKKH